MSAAGVQGTAAAGAGATGKGNHEGIEGTSTAADAPQGTGDAALDAAGGGGGEVAAAIG